MARVFRLDPHRKKMPDLTENTRLELARVAQSIQNRDSRLQTQQFCKVHEILS
jgi:hypothetical protein